MKIEDLKNTKIYLHSIDERVKFKNKVEKLGTRWIFWSDWDPTTQDIPFIYINEDLQLHIDCRKDFESFCSNRSKQIFLDDVLAIEEPKEECKFKPFDRVLVRANVDTRWKAREFAWFDPDKKEEFRYETTGGEFYVHCIPYEGNEELANTTKNK